MAPHDPTREATGKLIYEEAVRIRALQEARVNDLRARSISVVSVASAALVLAAAAGRDALNGWLAASTVVAIAAGTIAAIKVQHSFGQYVEGPDIDELINVQFDTAASLASVYRDLASYHYSDYNDNEDGPIDRMRLWFTVEAVFVSVAISVLLAGVVV